MTIHSTERPAIRPARAASAPFATPVTSNATISGMTVIFSALSHSPPTMSDACKRRLAQAVAERRGANSGGEAEKQRNQHPIGFGAAHLLRSSGFGGLAQRGFRKR